MKYTVVRIVLSLHYCSVLSTARILPTTYLQQNSAALQTVVKNLTINADNIFITNTSFIAKQLTIHADEVYLNKPDSLGKLDEFDTTYIDYPSLTSSINKTLNPCDDFYQFVCDGWIRSHPIPDYQLTTNQMDTNRLSIGIHINEILEHPEDVDKPEGSEVFFELYEKCMDIETRNQLKTTPIFNTLRKIKQANMKYVTDWMISVWPITLFYSIEVLPDFINSTLNRLTVLPSKSVVSPDFFFNERFNHQLQSFENYATHVLKIMAEDDVKGEFFKADEIPRRVASLIEVSRRIAKIEQQSIHLGEDDSAASIYNLRTLAELQELAPSVNWRSFLLGILPPNAQSEISLDTIMINVLDIESVKEVEKMITALNSTLLSDYLDWRIILSQVNYLDERFAAIWERYQEQAVGVQAKEPLWITCQTTTLTMFPEMANYFYITKHFPHENYDQLKQMIENIRQSFKGLIRESIWLDEITKSKSLLKTESIIDFIGYDATRLNRSIIEAKYIELNSILSWSYVNMMHAIKRWNYDHDFKRLTEANPRESFNFPPPEANAYYIPTRNQIVLLAGILQDSFFNKSFPTALNYGGIGVVIGHEITHAFDNEGSRYDEVGNMQNWWDNKTSANFRQLQDCFIKQYSEVEVQNTNGMKIDGKRTLTENIADNGGIRAAYKAMRIAIQNETGKQVKIRGLEEYGPDQLFFINFAYTWCSNTRQEAAPVLLIDDDHSPDRERVNTVVKNQDEYFHAFNCRGQTAQPEQCRLW